MAANTPSARIWVSDGSGAPFTDVVELPASHRGLFGGPAPYKGAIDPSVPVGTARPGADRADDTFVPEAEWCLTFPGGLGPYLEHPERVDSTTPVVFQGMVEGKWLTRVVGSMAWCPVSIGNNVLAAGPGIATTLGVVEDGAAGEMLVTYTDARGRTQQLRSTLTDLCGQSALELVRAVLAHCRQTGQAIDWIDFSAQGVGAAIQNDPKWLLAAVQATGLSPAALQEPAALQRVVDRAVRDILDAGLDVPPGTPVALEVRDGAGKTVGQADLVWRR